MTGKHLRSLAKFLMALGLIFFLVMAGVGTPKPSKNKTSTGPVLPPASSVPPAGVSIAYEYPLWNSPLKLAVRRQRTWTSSGW